jgi:hypothetical protein
MLGVWLVDLAGLGNYNVKLAVLLANLVGGVLLGLGFGMTGYCPGTGLACAATGRLDAVVSVAGMLAGALGFLLLSPWIVPALESVWDYGETTLPEITATPQAVWVLPLAALGSVLLWLTRPLAGGADRPRARR